MKKQPEQTNATRQKLLDAFWDIYQNKTIDKITIGEITRTAGYNRGTFYEYFTDIYDMLNQIEDDLIERIKAEIMNTFQTGFPKSISEYSLKCSIVFKKYDDKVFTLLGTSGDSNFGFKLKTIFISLFKDLFQIPAEIPNSDYIITFIYSALVGMMTYWYENNKNLSEEEFLSMLQKLVASGIMGYANIALFE